MPALPRFPQLPAVLALAVTLSLATPTLKAQSTPLPAQQPQPDSGGPANDQGPIVIPKKKIPATDSTPPSAAANPPQSTSSIPLTAQAPEVTINVGVLLEKTHNFLPGLKPANFRLYEDGQEQKVIGFQHSEAPITVLILCDSASTSSAQLFNQIRSGVSNFASQLRPEDSVALMTFAQHTRIVTDLTQDKSELARSEPARSGPDKSGPAKSGPDKSGPDRSELAQAINQLPTPDSASSPASGSSQHNLYDALYEGLDRLSRIESQKYILLITSPQDTSSKTTLDQLLDKIRNTPETTIFTISTYALAPAIPEDRAIPEARTSSEVHTDSTQPPNHIGAPQADEPMHTFAKISGGLSFTPRSPDETADNFKLISEAIRSKYQLTYYPSNPRQDGTYRRIQVELVDDQGHPLILEDEKHKPLKYALVVREGYRAHSAVE